MNTSVPPTRALTPCVIDIYHGDIVEGQRDGSYSGFAKLKAAGFLGVIHKATQGAGVSDQEYARRRKPILDADLLHGAYHFNTGDTIAAQVQHFVDVAQPTDATLMALDWEDNKNGNMSIDQVVDFLTRLYAIIKRRPKLYTGNRGKQMLAHADEVTRAFFALHPLWLCEYGPIARMVDVNGYALPWAKWWMWQRDADGFGPDFHDAPGILTPNLDQNVYAGTPDQLAAEWAGSAAQAAAAAPPAQAAAHIAAQPGAAPTTAPARQTNIVATCFGGAGDKEASAYGGAVDPSKPGVALPFRFHVPTKVNVIRGTASVICDVIDVGPHNTDDAYWQGNARPRAESQDGNHAGIDMTPAVFAALGIAPTDPEFGLTKVDWVFA